MYNFYVHCNTNKRKTTIIIICHTQLIVTNINIPVLLIQETLQSKGYIYRGKYEGWYCVSDEAFLTSDQVMEITNDNGSKLHVSYIVIY